MDLPSNLSFRQPRRVHAGSIVHTVSSMWSRAGTGLPTKVYRGSIYRSLDESSLPGGIYLLLFLPLPRVPGRLFVPRYASMVPRKLFVPRYALLHGPREAHCATLCLFPHGPREAGCATLMSSSWSPGEAVCATRCLLLSKTVINCQNCQYWSFLIKC